jgi:uncharacterized protein YbjT (DUF2867 family)
MNMGEIILVTGATGNVASEVVEQLLKQSLLSSHHNRIKAAVHLQNKVDKLKKYNKEVEIVALDYNKAETIANALNEVRTNGIQ